MSISKKNDPKFVMAYDRSMFRSAVVSLFWSIISERRKEGGFTFQGLAKKIGSTKHEVSRWFSGESPNWTLNTVASIANALDVDIRVQAIERSTGRIFTASGIQEPTKSKLVTSGVSYQSVLVTQITAPALKPLSEITSAAA